MLIFDLVKLLHKDSEGVEKIVAHEFLTLAACNTVIPIVNQSVFVGCIGIYVEEENVDIDYQGESLLGLIKINRGKKKRI